MSKTTITSPELAPPVGPFSQAVDAGGFILEPTAISTAHQTRHGVPPNSVNGRSSAPSISPTSPTAKQPGRRGSGAGFTFGVKSGNTLG